MTSAIRSYGLLFKWQVLRFRTELPMIVVIQCALALGIVYGMAFLIPNIDPQTAAYLATGAPTMSLLIMGLNIVQQETTAGRLTGRFDYLSSLPIPRLATLAADVTFWLLAQLPGTVLAIFLARLRFGFSLDVSPLVVPAIALVAFAGASVGYAMAKLIQPQIANQLASFVSIGILLFSPVNFPVDRLPGPMQVVHQFLPVKHMADLVRWSLTGRYVSSVGVAFAVVAAWCAAGLYGSYRAATKLR
ncbi:MAG: ABC transporter permease [Actinomycetota bacterium]